MENQNLINDKALEIFYSLSEFEKDNLACGILPEQFTNLYKIDLDFSNSVKDKLVDICINHAHQEFKLLEEIFIKDFTQKLDKHTDKMYLQFFNGLSANQTPGNQQK